MIFIYIFAHEMKQPINPIIKITAMPKGRAKKDRTQEVNSIFDNLKFCSYDDLTQIIKSATERQKKIKAEELEALKKQREAIDAKIAEMEKEG